MQYSQEQLTQLIEREHGKFFHPRTGAKFAGCTANDHVMPPDRGTHLNGCPKIAYHRATNAIRPSFIDASLNQTTGQIKTIYGGEQGNYAGFHQIKNHQTPRWSAKLPTPVKRTCRKPNRY